ncbi:hypothetical protein AAFN46_17175 [Pseudomonas sp. CAU 1711]|uniref:hypothetical protein n=1 Tax=Pseudomonas sp. CAU 1711 TaxID=3140356 RepID=UPI003260E23B
MHHPSVLVLRLAPALLLIGLILLALSPLSHSPAGVLLLFLVSLCVSLGFLPLSSRQLEESERKARHSA